MANTKEVLLDDVAIFVPIQNNWNPENWKEVKNNWENSDHIWENARHIWRIGLEYRELLSFLGNSSKPALLIAVGSGDFGRNNNLFGIVLGVWEIYDAVEDEDRGRGQKWQFLPKSGESEPLKTVRKKYIGKRLVGAHLQPGACYSDEMKAMLKGHKKSKS